MIYSFNDKYYVNIGPRIYIEVIPSLKGDELTFKNGISRLELNNPPLSVTLEDIKEKLKNKQDDKKQEEKKTNKRITRW